MKVIMLGLHNLAKVYDKLSTSLKRSDFQSKGTKDNSPINIAAAMKPATYPTVS
jgi:hypothetical protein